MHSTNYSNGLCPEWIMQSNWGETEWTWPTSEQYAQHDTGLEVGQWTYRTFLRPILCSWYLNWPDAFVPPSWHTIFPDCWKTKHKNSVKSRKKIWVIHRWPCSWVQLSIHLMVENMIHIIWWLVSQLNLVAQISSFIWDVVQSYSSWKIKCKNGFTALQFDECLISISMESMNWCPWLMIYLDLVMTVISLISFLHFNSWFPSFCRHAGRVSFFLSL